MDDAINLSLGRQDPPVQVRMPCPTILPMDCECGVPEPEESSWRGIRGPKTFDSKRVFLEFVLDCSQLFIRL